MKTDELVVIRHWMWDIFLL